MRKHIAAVLALIFSLNVWANTDFSQLRLNEISGENTALFVEIFNAGNVDIPLNGVRLQRNEGAAAGGTEWVGQASDVIPAGAYRIILFRNGRGDGNNSGAPAPSQLQASPAWPGMSWTVNGGLSDQQILKIALVDPYGDPIDIFIRGDAPLLAWGTEGASRLSRVQTPPYGNLRPSYSRMADGSWGYARVTPGATNGPRVGTIVNPGYLTEVPALHEPEDLRSHPLFDLSALPTITFEFSVEEWNRSLVHFDQNPRHEERIIGNFVFYRDGVETRLQHPIGFRIRGNTSRRRPEGHYGEMHNPNNPVWRNAHFNINFSTVNGGQRFHGLRRLNLKWHKDDPMFVREIYSYDLLQRFGVWTAPRASYARVYIRVGDGAPAYFGIYAMIEHIDQDFLTARRGIGQFETSNGNLWKCTHAGGSNGGPADLRIDGALHRMGVEDIRLDESQSRRFSYDLKTNTGNLANARTQFYNWIVNLNTLTGEAFRQWITANFDVDLFLRTYAVNVVLGHWDGYWGNSNNFYLYFESHTGRAFFIPYDFDNVLGTSLFFDAGREDVLRWGGSGRPLITRILAIPEFREQYLLHLNQLIHPDNDLFHVDRSIARIEGWHDLVRNYITPETIENNESAHNFIDRPATWGNQHHYRLLERGANNFFEVRAANIPHRAVTPNYPPTNIVIPDVETQCIASLRVFPNPVTDGVLFVELPVNTTHEIVKVFNLSGRLVLAQSATYPKTKIDFSHLPSGVYIVHIGDGSVRVVKL